jgi:hypothetical protein
MPESLKMRKFLLVSIIASVIFLCTAVAVRATTRVSTVNEVQLGRDMADVLAGLKGNYSIQGDDAAKDVRHYFITNGPDHRFYYEIFAVKGKVAAVWTEDAKAYSGDTNVVGTELFDALYAAAPPRRDSAGDVMGRPQHECLG